MTEEQLRSILIAGVGNAWLRDDGFGSAVARRLSELDLPASCRRASRWPTSAPAVWISPTR